MDRPLVYDYERESRPYNPYGGVHSYPGATTELPQGPRPAGPPTPWGKWAIWGTAAVATAAVIAVGAFAGGRASTEATTITTTTTVEPEAKAYTAADITWCKEYSAQDQRILDKQSSDGLPRKMAARDLPASDWTTVDRASNMQFVKVLEAGVGEPMVKLQVTAQNPVLRSLMNAQIAAERALLEKIRDATYVPADYALFRTFSSSLIAVDGVCEEISRS
ncbi:hypothetical protein [Mycobacteroides salmoniphilum]|nr:hypothetical protein [Mycobacteroides salmoniphilum]